MRDRKYVETANSVDQDKPPNPDVQCLLSNF